MDKNKKLIIVIIILAVIAGGVSFFAVHEAQKNNLIGNRSDCRDRKYHRRYLANTELINKIR
jgi:capsular polysaccharide biosynthesis protein